MINPYSKYKERPKLRKVIVGILRENPSVELVDIAMGRYLQSGYRVYVAINMRTQAKKMIEEGFSRNRLKKAKLYNE